jgi:hypothetical protein
VSEARELKFIWGLYRGEFNYSGELIILHSMAVGPKAAKRNMINQLADDHGVERRQVAMIFDGRKNNFQIEIDREWREKHAHTP